MAWIAQRTGLMRNTKLDRSLAAAGDTARSLAASFTRNLVTVGSALRCGAAGQTADGADRAARFPRSGKSPANRIRGVHASRVQRGLGPGSGSVPRWPLRV